MQETTPKQAYKSVTVTTPGGGLESVEGENYSALPIVPLWGSDLHQSTLVGLKAYIDNTDLVSPVSAMTCRTFRRSTGCARTSTA